MMSRLDPERSTYPHLPRRWRDQVSIELRVRGASGASIGEALALAESHCADSGEEPTEALGTPTEYASGVALPADERPSTAGEMLRGTLPALVGLCGMTLAFGTASAWRTRGSVEVTWGILLGLGIILLAAVALVAFAGFLLGRHLILGALMLAAALALTVTAQLTLTATALTVRPFVAAVFAVALLAASALWPVPEENLDPVTDPLRGDPSPGATRALRRLGPWLFPAATLLGVLLIAMIPG